MGQFSNPKTAAALADCPQLWNSSVTETLPEAKATFNYKESSPITKYYATSYRYRGGRWHCDSKFFFLLFWLLDRLKRTHMCIIQSHFLLFCSILCCYLEEVLNFPLPILPPLPPPPLPPPPTELIWQAPVFTPWVRCSCDFVNILSIYQSWISFDCHLSVTLWSQIKLLGRRGKCSTCFLRDDMRHSVFRISVRYWIFTRIYIA